LPWYCIPAIDFLSIIDFREAEVLEFGSGQSTLWWASRAQSVVAVEESAEWYAYVCKNAPPNALILLESNLTEHAQAPKALDRTFDVVVIDGGDRALAAATAIEVVRSDGIILVDNSEGFWGREGTYPILDLLDQAGYSRVDFNGYQLGVVTTSVTSLFFRGECRWLRNLSPPTKGHR
jgi:hypothetical protein